MEVLSGILSEKWQWVLDSSPYLNIFPNCYFFCASNAQMEWWPSTWVNNIFQHKADLPKRDRGSGSCTMLLVPTCCLFRVCACVQCFNLPTTLVKRWSHGLFANRKDREIRMLIMEPFICPSLLICFSQEIPIVQCFLSSCIHSVLAEN